MSFAPPVGSQWDPVVLFNQDIARKRLAVATENAQAVAAIKDRWAQQLAANQRAADLGVAYTYPTYDPAPRKKVLDETTGVITEVPFSDLVPPTLPTATPPATPGTLRPPSAGPDPQAVTQFMLSQILQKLDQLLGRGGT